MASSMSCTAALREAMKAAFYPFAFEHGFVRGKATSLFAPFRRIRGGVAHVFDIQWEKYGRPRFVINFGEAPSAGVTFQGELVPADKLEPFHCQLNGRLQRWRGGSLRTWFQLSRPWPETLRTLRWAYSPEEVVTQLMNCFAELETWWDNKQEGPHVNIWRRAG